MILKAVVLWVFGMVTIVPYGTYYLFMKAERDQYALLITLVLFWVFGYWGVAGPILALAKVRGIVTALETAQGEGRLREALRSPETANAAVDLIASENGIPRFMAARVYRLLIDRLDLREGF